jgi:hypothetical protein
MSEELWFHVTAGKGPGKCAWAVVKVVERFCAECAAAGIVA